MSAKFYAVLLRDGTSRVLTSWDAAKSLVSTNPKGARYKRFSSEADALAFLDAGAPRTGRDAHPELARPTAPRGHCVAFVDGSYNAETRRWGYGAVLYDPARGDDSVVELSGDGVTDVQSRNVTGEIHAAVEAVKAAIRLGYDGVEIYHDYQGVASWANAAWATNCDLTLGYKLKIQELRRRITVNFHKVPAHSGVDLNERADLLAKRGCGLA